MNFLGGVAWCVGEVGWAIARVPACAGMTDGGAGVTGRGRRSDGRAREMRGCDGGAAWGIGVRRDWWVGSLPFTPHLTSPLEGGRDELGWR